MSPSLPMRVIARSIGTESEEKSLTIIKHAESFEWSNAALAVRLGIPPLADDGRSHPCGGRVYRSCISSKQEQAGQRIEPGTGIHPNRAAKGYAGIRIRIGWRAAEGEGEMMDRPRIGIPTCTEADDQRLRLLAVSGKTSREIAREIGRSVDAVQARAKKARGPR